MRSKFKYMVLDKKTFFKLNSFNEVHLDSGRSSILPFVKFIKNKSANVVVHNGIQHKKIKKTTLSSLLHDNYFFVKDLKTGSFRFTKKQCT